VAISKGQWQAISTTLLQTMDRALARRELERIAVPLQERANLHRACALNCAQLRKHLSKMEFITDKTRLTVELLNQECHEDALAKHYDFLASVGHGGLRHRQREILRTWKLLGGTFSERQKLAAFFEAVSSAFFSKKAPDEIRRIIQQYHDHLMIKESVTLTATPLGRRFLADLLGLSDTM
jgi:hypothetical protein